MACANLLVLALKCFHNQGVQQLGVDQVWTGQLGAVPCEFFLEGLRGVHAQGFRLAHLQLEVDEQLHVLVEGFDGVHAVAVVLAEHVFKVGQRDALTCDVQDIGALAKGRRGNQGQRHGHAGKSGQESGSLHGLRNSIQRKL